MKRSLTFLTLLSICSGAAAPRAAAQQIDSPYRFIDTSQFVGVGGGYLLTGESRLDTGPRSAPFFGVSWGLRVSGPFTITVDAGYSPTTRTVRDTVFLAADSMYREIGEADVKLLTAMGSLRFNLTGSRTWNAIQPFGILGAGIAIDLASGSELEEGLPANTRFDFGTSFAGQLGAGVDWFPSSRVSVRLDARNMLWKVPIAEAFLLTENGADLPLSEWEQNFALAAGLSIHF